PVEVAGGDEVTGATVNLSGKLVVRATRVGADTQLAQMARLVAQAQAGKAPVQRLADRISAVFVPVVIAVAAATFGFWLLAGAGRGARLGVLIKGPEVLESTRRIDTVVVDKTGTVTAGAMALVGEVTAGGLPPETLRRYAAAVEHASEHPIARAVAAAVPDH